MKLALMIEGQEGVTWEEWCALADACEQHGIETGDWVAITSRRSSITLQAQVVRTIRPDTVFIPYHWPHDRSANRLTHRTLDPRSKIPEYKVSACRIEKAAAPGGRA